jgi:hypothetical protein
MAFICVFSQHSFMPDARVVDGIYTKWSALIEELDERGRRRWAATEAIAIGRGGVAAVTQATGLVSIGSSNGTSCLRFKRYHFGDRDGDGGFWYCLT